VTEPTSPPTTELLRGRRAVVTGSSRGLGRAYAHALAAHGAQVVVNGTTPHLVDEVVAEITAAGGTAVGVTASVTTFDGAERIVGTGVDAFGGVDIVVNNAGVVRERMMFNMTEEEFRACLDVDCFGTFAVSRFAVRDMRPRGWGRIINTGDISAQTGLLGGTNVAAAKGAIHAMTYTWASELRHWGITANCVIPEAYTRLHEPLNRKAIELAVQRGDEQVPTMEEMAARTPQPAEITALLVYLASDESAWLSGQVLTMTKRRIALWSHAHPKARLTRADGFTVDDVRAALTTAFAAEVEPVGIDEPWATTGP
jgi:NAD(P)-dependent dehydrogenase (short-subunit alcohol dehydrogenase family)